MLSVEQRDILGMQGNGSILYGALESSSTTQWAGFGLAQTADQMIGANAIIVKPCSSCSTGASVDKYLLAGYDSSQVVAGTGNLTLLGTSAASSSRGLQTTFTAALPQATTDLDSGSNIM